jgi:hypothetical protein
MQASPAKLEIPSVVDFAMSHRCAIKLLHAVRIRMLILGNTSGGHDKYMTDDVGKLSLKFFDPVTRFIFLSSSRLRDYNVYIAPCSACTNFSC